MTNAEIALLLNSIGLILVAYNTHLILGLISNLEGKISRGTSPGLSIIKKTTGKLRPKVLTEERAVKAEREERNQI